MICDCPICSPKAPTSGHTPEEAARLDAEAVRIGVTSRDDVTPAAVEAHERAKGEVKP